MPISITSNTSQPLSPFSTVAPETATLKEKASFSASSSTLANRDSTLPPVDTVSISTQSQKKATEAKNEEAKKEPTKNSNSDTAGAAVAKVQFVYSPKGELSIRYMDTDSRIVYQTPSELMLRLKEALTKSETSVDTSA
ncbi:MAG: hypothetical protein PHP95_16040 [Desulfuromonadaceae bacterium]|nr:hypothetical protein [Desulfuromonadaceae bacterium]MDD2849963.1 hypothetical protein [Desulfuromonadaceae bacterium]MDD4131204.1 hypothetical protein [Desulfuromonadaceae bacterium]